MKKLIQSKTIWFNSILIAAPIIIQVINMVDAELLDALGFAHSPQVMKILSFAVGAIGIILRLQTTTPIGSKAIESDMYLDSILKWRNSEPLTFDDFENLWIIVNCPDCVIEYGVNPIEQNTINTMIVTDYPDPTVFNADKKPYPKGKF